MIRLGILEIAALALKHLVPCSTKSLYGISTLNRENDAKQY
jgi:hypothetical protein